MKHIDKDDIDPFRFLPMLSGRFSWTLMDDMKRSLSKIPTIYGEASSISVYWIKDDQEKATQEQV